MKNAILFILLLISGCYLAQDTLNCKEHLAWDKKQKLYYRKDDGSKQKYTGPAKCFPKGGGENRGYLKNGAWEGTVYGYKGGQVLGFSTFSDGLYDGLTIKYNDKGLVKDSMIYNQGTLVYHKKAAYDDYDQLDEVYVDEFKHDTLIRYEYHYDGGVPYELEITRYYGKKKNGAWEKLWYEELNDGTKRYIPGNVIVYKEGVKTAERQYDGGYLYTEYIFENGKKIRENLYEGDVKKKVQETPYNKSGKIHGRVNYFDAESHKLYQVEIYENGKLVETKEIN